MSLTCVSFFGGGKIWRSFGKSVEREAVLEVLGDKEKQITTNTEVGKEMEEEKREQGKNGEETVLAS